VAPSAVVLNDFTWTLFYPRKLIYQDHEGSSTPGKPVLPLRQVNVLAIYTESNHQYILSDLTVVVHSADWLHLNTFLHAEDVLSRTRRFLNTWKPVLPLRQVNVPAIYTEASHEYRLSDPTAVLHSADWLHLNTFLPVEAALPRTRRLLNIWKNGFTVMAIQFSGHVTGSHHKYTLSEPRAVAYSPDWLHQNTGLPTEYAVPRTTRLFKTLITSIGMNSSWYCGHFQWIKPWLHTF